MASTPTSGGSSTSPTTRSSARTSATRPRSTCSTCWATRAAAAAALRSLERAVPRPGRERPGDRSVWQASWPGPASRSTRSWWRSSDSMTEAYRLDLRRRGGTKEVKAQRRWSLAIPFAVMRESVDYSDAGFDPVKSMAIEQQGMGTNSKLNVQFSDARLARPRSQRRHLCRRPATSRAGRRAAPSPGRAGILVDYTGGTHRQGVRRRLGRRTRQGLRRAARAGAARSPRGPSTAAPFSTTGPAGRSRAAATRITASGR